MQRNEKYSKAIKKKDSLPLKLDISTLQAFCDFVVSDNETIYRTNYINLDNLINLLDLSLYQNDTEKMVKLDFIKKGLEARLVYNLNKKELILSHINGGLLDDTLNVYTEEIHNAEVQWINTIVLNSLNYGYMINEAADMQKICNKITTGDFYSNNTIADEFVAKIKYIHNKIRQTEANSSSKLYFSLENDNFVNAITDVHKKKSSPNNRLITGCVGINELLGGGFESKRVYSFFGLPGEGKSITLLDMCLQIKNYNKGYICKDPTKKPCIVYLTLENGLEETIERLIQMVGIEGSITDYTVIELVNKLKTEGQLYLDNSSPIDLIMRYEPGMSIDTNYLYTMADDLADSGKELIAVAVDYIKRIRSIEPSQELRIQYGNIINEFHNFAGDRELVVLTASQLNRDATQHIDESRRNNRLDLVRTLGRSQVGESGLILENLDGAFLILPEIINNEKWLGIQRIKNRYKASDRAYLYYKYIHGIKLLEDLNCIEPGFKTTLKENVQPNFSTSRYNTVKTMDDVELYRDKEEDNIFLLGNVSTIEDDTKAIQSSFSNNYNIQDNTPLDEKPKLICPVKRLVP